MQISDLLCRAGVVSTPNRLGANPAAINPTRGGNPGSTAKNPLLYINEYPKIKVLGGALLCFGENLLDKAICKGSYIF